MNLAADESVLQFTAKLRRLMRRHCEFKTFLEEVLSDHFVCVLSSKAIQNCLLYKTELTLQKAVDLTMGIEAVVKDITELQATAIADVTNKDMLKGTVNHCWSGKSNHQWRSYTRAYQGTGPGRNCLCPGKTCQ